MKKYSISIISAVVLALLVVTTVLADFTNGDFELGSFSGWTKATFLNGVYPTRNAGGSDLSVVLGPFATMSQSDPYTNGGLKYPPYGQYVARVNNEQSWSGGGYKTNGNTLSQIATVQSTDVDPSDGLVHVRFIYAGVMVNPSHPAGQNPYIYVAVKNHTKGDDLLYEFQSYAGEAGRGWLTGPIFSGDGVSNWQYLPWEYVDIAESVTHPVDVGDEVYVEVTAAGCSPSGHPGYAYVDEFSFLKPAPLITASDNPDPVYSGANLTYTFNYSAINAVASPVLTIPLPANTSFVSVSDTAHCAFASGNLTCNMPDLAAYASGAPFTMTVKVNASSGSTLNLVNYKAQGTSTKVYTGTQVDTQVIAPPNTLPVASNDGYSTSANTLLNGSTVLVNDTDADLDTLTAALDAGPSHSSAFAFKTDGTFTYTPAAGFVGQDTFTYHANDGTADSNIATVTIDVTNSSPTIAQGANVTVTMSEDGAPIPWDLTLTATDPDNDPLTWSIETKPTYGIASVDATTGVVSYTPFNNYFGKDAFKVSVSDGTVSVSITVNVIVVQVDDPNLEANSSWLIYNGWRNGSGVGYLDGDFISSTKGNLYLPVPSSASSLTLTVTVGPNQGKMQVLIDNVVYKGYDLYNATLIKNYNLVIPLSGTNKKVTIAALGTKNTASTGTAVQLDSYFFNSSSPMNSDLKLALWSNFFRTGSANYRATMQPGNVILEFKGQKVGWYTYTGPDAGKVEVYIDGTYIKTIDLYSATPQWGVIFKFGPFPYALHNLEFRVVTNGPIVVMDKIDKE
jgi:hypothetical protein